MNILIAPDSLKGSLSALEFCAITARQLTAVNPSLKVHQIPLADGGEGTLDAILASVDGKRYSVTVENPLGHPVIAEYAILDDNNTAIIEMAQASGLPLIVPDALDPLHASSYGTGQLIENAVARGCRRLIVGLGGSATNDGGMGMLQALGVIFKDVHHRPLKAGGAALKLIDSIDITGLDPAIKDCEFIIAGDVTNPLLGEHGATRIFGPQKGADDLELQQLESAMQHFADKVIEVTDTKPELMVAPGAGAAGGMGFSLMAFFNARLTSGFELIAELVKLDRIFNSETTRPDWVITAEGQFDHQSLHGKLVGRMLERTIKYEIPLIVICGSIGDTVNQSNLPANVTVFSLCDAPMSLEHAMQNSPRLLENLIQNLAKILSLSQ